MTREEVSREPVLAAVDGGSGKVVSCPLCLDNATSLTTTLCGHVFCKEVRPEPRVHSRNGLLTQYFE